MDRLLYFLILAASMLLGWFVGQSSRQPRHEPHREADVDTVSVRTETDTVTFKRPAPAKSLPAETVTARLSLAAPREPRDSATGEPETADSADAVPDEPPDSASVEIPITRNVYEDSLYRLAVSGYMVSVDELEIYPRREIVTVTRPPKRWHLGVSVGYGLTPRGFQPVVGATLTYSLISF